jgi:PQQ-dependent catabolism-associated CXXCW motif protein
MQALLRSAVSMLLVCAAGLAHSQDASDEAADFGVPASDELRLSAHATPTPLTLRGGAVIGTRELMRRLQEPIETRPLLFDVLTDSHESLPGTIWLPGAGYGTGFDDAIQTQLAAVLAQASGGNRSRAVVFFCSSVRCWLSYNVALRAIRLGYSNVYWYRGGIAAWLAAGGDIGPPRIRWKPPA